MKALLNADIEIVELSSPEEIKKVEHVQKLAWKMEDREILPSHMLIASRYSGGIILGAYKGDELVGFIFSFLGRRGKKFYHHCHMVGVLPQYQNRGVGFSLFKALRDRVIEEGHDLIIWTFDPLRPAHANLFIRKLGAISRRYYRNFYAELTGELDAGMLTDRFLVEWWIKSHRVEERMKGILSPTNEFEEARVVNDVSIVDGIEETIQYEVGLEDPVLLVEIPSDLLKVKRKLEVTTRWRMSIREIFESYLNKGYIVTDFISKIKEGIRKNFYVLEKSLLEGIGEF